jgi:hypothetical protein
VRTLLVTLGPFFASTLRSAEAPTSSTSNATLRDISATAYPDPAPSCELAMIRSRGAQQAGAHKAKAGPADTDVRTCVEKLNEGVLLFVTSRLRSHDRTTITESN